MSINESRRSFFKSNFIQFKAFWFTIQIRISLVKNCTINTGSAINYCEISLSKKTPQFWSNFLKVGRILIVINGGLCWYPIFGFWTIFETCKACKTGNLKILFSLPWTAATDETVFPLKLKVWILHQKWFKTKSLGIITNRRLYQTKWDQLLENWSKIVDFLLMVKFRNSLLRTLYYDGSTHIVPFTRKVNLS